VHHRDAEVRKTRGIVPRGRDVLGARKHPVAAVERRVENLRAVVQPLPRGVKIVAFGLHGEEVEVDDALGRDGGGSNDDRHGRVP